MLGRSISKNSLLLAAFALATAGTLALTNLGTKDRIATAERAAQQRALFEIVPLNMHDNDLLNDTMAVPSSAQELLHVSDDAVIYRARHNGEISALIVPARARDGYSGDIDLIVGVNRDGSLAGVRVIKHKETPGLGDKIDLKKNPWILSFNGKSLQLPTLDFWKVKKDGGEFDQFAGATITPRAVVGQVKRVLEFVAANQATLFIDSQPNSSEAHDADTQHSAGEPNEQ
jgi:Na+-translocating ferredoxin:NAD+ oxidoreductase subunit G